MAPVKTTIVSPVRLSVVSANGSQKVTRSRGGGGKLEPCLTDTMPLSVFF